MKRNKKYINEYRRKLKNLQHPPEKLKKVIDDLEDQIMEFENKYGFHEGQLSHWHPVTDDLPFPDPNTY